MFVDYIANAVDVLDGKVGCRDSLEGTELKLSKHTPLEDITMIPNWP